MSGWKRHLQGARRATEPAPRTVDRVRARALAAAPRRRWPLVAGVLALAAAGLAWLGPTTPPAPLDTELAGAGRVPLTGDVRLEFDGLGSVAGTAREPRIRWASGHLRVEVTPDRGVGLVVHTEEAEIEVVGTGFGVDRSALGTTVAVEHGAVAVRCADGTGRTVTAGESADCLPISAAALLGRGRALRAAGRPDAEVLDTADRGLAACAAGTPQHGELLVLRLGVLVGAGRDAEALETAEAYLASGATAREAEVRGVVERLRGR